MQQDDTVSNRSSGIPQVLEQRFPSVAVHKQHQDQRQALGDYQGAVCISQLSHASSPQEIDDFLQAWAIAPTFSWWLAPAAGQPVPGCLTLGSPASQWAGQAIAGMAVCLAPDSVTYIHLGSMGAVRDSASSADRLWEGIRQAFSRDNSCKVSFGMSWQLLAMMGMNVFPRGALQDLLVAYLLLHPQVQDEEVPTVQSVFNSLVRWEPLWR